MSERHRKTLSRNDVTAIVGPLDDARLAAIIGTGATADQVMEAFTRLASDGPLDPDTDHRLDSTVARVYEILSEGRFEDEEEDGP